MKRLYCWLFGHRYEVWQHFHAGSRRVICNHCGGDFGMHDETRSFVRWDSQLEDMYTLMGYRIRKRPGSGRDCR
jgi:hypothetical protein